MRHSDGWLGAQVAEAAVAAHDGDGRVAQAGEIARHVAHVCPTTIFVVGEVAHIVQAVLDVPVSADHGQEFLGPGALGAERGQTVGNFDAAFAGLEDLAFAVDAQRLAATVEVGVAVPFGTGEVDDGAASVFDAAMALVDGLVPGCVAPVDRLEVFVHRRLVVLDGGHQVIGVALIDQIVCGLLLGMQCIDGDDTPGEVETAGECAHGRDFIALAVDLELSEDQTRAVFERRDHHPAPLLSLLARRRANPCHHCHPWQPGRARSRAGRPTCRWRCPGFRAVARRGCCGRW